MLFIICWSKVWIKHLLFRLNVSWDYPPSVIIVWLSLLIVLLIVFVLFIGRLHSLRMIIWWMWTVMSDNWVLGDALPRLVCLRMQIWCWALVLLLCTQTFIHSLPAYTTVSCETPLIPFNVVVWYQRSRYLVVSVI